MPVCSACISAFFYTLSFADCTCSAGSDTRAIRMVTMLLTMLHADYIHLLTPSALQVVHGLGLGYGVLMPAHQPPMSTQHSQAAVQGPNLLVFWEQGQTSSTTLAINSLQLWHNMSPQRPPEQPYSNNIQ